MRIVAAGLLLGLMLTHRPAAAQDSIGIRIDAARTPSAPAFVLLDIEPTAIERPTTPRALAFSLISATQQGSTLPRNYALAIAPYWLSSHPSLTFDRYYKAGIGQSILQSLSISLATSRPEDSSASAGDATRLGFGLRTLVVPGRASPRLRMERERLTTAQGDYILAVDSLDQLREALSSLPSGGDCDTRCARDRKAITTAIEGAVADSGRTGSALRPIALGIQQLDHERVGWAVEFAAAVTGRFPDDSWDDAEVERIGVWLTPSYRPADDQLDFMAVGRYLRSLRAEVEASYFDVGGRVRWEQGPLAASGEFIYRSRNPDDGSTTTSVRAVGQVDYRVTRDIHVTGTFGKNYDSDAPGGERLVAQLGIDFGLGSVPLVGLR